LLVYGIAIRGIVLISRDKLAKNYSTYFLESSSDLSMQNIRISSTQPMKLAFYLTGGIIVLLVAIIFRPFTIINAGERGVVMRFGKVQNTILDEGIHPIMPVVTSIKKLNVRVQKNDFQADAASKDLQKVTTNVAVNWRIDPERVNLVYQQIGEQEQIVTGIITPAVSEVLKAATAKKTAEEIITKRTALKDEIDNALKTRLAAYGIQVNDVSLVDFGFSPEFTKAIEAKQIAEQEAKQAEYIALKASKEAQADVNRAKGQAEAQKLLRENLTSQILQKQAIEKWDGRFPQVMGGSNALPLINVSPPSQPAQPK
jgi:prohibitin 1